MLNGGDLADSPDAAVDLVRLILTNVIDSAFAKSFMCALQVLDFVVDGDLADAPDTMVELEVYDQHWISDEAVRGLRSFAN